MKIINVTDKAVEWTFDAGHYTLGPGLVGDYPPEICHHAVRKCSVQDPDTGELLELRVRLLDEVDKGTVRQFAAYQCPFAMTNQCDALPFKSIDDLKKHLDGHWTAAAAPNLPLQAELAGKAPAARR